MLTLDVDTAMRLALMSGVSRKIISDSFVARSTISSDQHHEKDTLGYEDYAEVLGNVLKDKSLPTPITVGIHGSWGKGKTFLLDLLEKKLFSEGPSTEQKASIGQGNRVCGLHKWRVKGSCMTWTLWIHLLFWPLMFMLITGTSMWGVIVTSDFLKDSNGTVNVTTAPPCVNITPTKVLVVNTTGSGNISVPLGTPSPPCTTNLKIKPKQVITTQIVLGIFFGGLAVVLLLYCCIGHCFSKNNADDFNTCSPGMWQDFLHLAVLMFYTPPQTLPNKEADVEIIQVKFNAWEYAGCDFLWAGIVTNLCSTIEEKYGLWTTRMFRLNSDMILETEEVDTKNDRKVTSTPKKQESDVKEENNMAKRRQNKKEGNEIEMQQLNSGSSGVEDSSVVHDAGRSITVTPKVITIKEKTTCGISNYVWIFILLSVIIISITGIVVVSIKIAEDDSEDGTIKNLILGVSSIILGGTVMAKIRPILKAFDSFCFSQAERIQKLQQRMTKPNFDEELGFMHKVKEEVMLTSKLIHYMERVLQKHIRIMITIDDLDRCEKEKILKILEAINILLSDPCAPFISVLAIDPRIVVKSVEQSFDKVLLDANINGHEYLKKIIQLPFCLPTVNPEKVKGFIQHRLKMIEDLEVATNEPVQNNVEPVQNNVDGNKKDEHRRPSNSGGPAPAPARVGGGIEVNSNNGVAVPPADRKPDIKRKNAMISALHALEEHPKLLSDNPRSIKRICNILFIAVELFMKQKQWQPRDEEDAERRIKQLAWWIVFTEQWPYRASWFVQYLEDIKQDIEIERDYPDTQVKTLSGSTTDTSNVSPQLTIAVTPNTTKHEKAKARLKALLRMTDRLMDHYSNFEHAMSHPSDWKSLMSLDYDPELFKIFLKHYHQFTFQDLEDFLPCTVNLDRSLKYIIATSKAEIQVDAGIQRLEYKLCMERPLQVELPTDHLTGQGAFV